MEASNPDVQIQLDELDSRVAALETELVGIKGAKQPPQVDTSTVPDEGPPASDAVSAAAPQPGVGTRPQPGVGSGRATPSQESSPSAPAESAPDQPAPGVPPQG